jgi:hypothetical protein
MALSSELSSEGLVFPGPAPKIDGIISKHYQSASSTARRELEQNDRRSREGATAEESAQEGVRSLLGAMLHAYFRPPSFMLGGTVRCRKADRHQTARKFRTHQRPF